VDRDRHRPYRIDDEAGALQAWMSAAQTESAQAWLGWRSVAEQQVRDGDLNAAMEAYKEADRRAPPNERPAIASRLAWLAKETGHDFVARREFNRSRGAYATYIPHRTLDTDRRQRRRLRHRRVPGRHDAASGCPARTAGRLRERSTRSRPRVVADLVPPFLHLGSSTSS
jgi:hypothetical protein